jgi:DNA-binding transcriptional ArsR family regulator
MAERKQPAPAAPDAVLRALADPHRRQILRLVQHAELPAGQIAASFTLTQQAVSQHIGVLRQAGLLTVRRQGARRLYALNRESLEPVRELLSEFWPDAPQPPEEGRRDGPPPTTGKAAVTAEIRNDVIVATEHIKAPPEVIFPYFTDPALIVKWIGDRAALDPQPGGVFSLDMGEATAHGAYITVDPPYRVAFS